MVLQMENKKRDKARDILVAEGRLGSQDKTAFADLTDKQNPRKSVSLKSSSGSR
jgi:hypothetical protein